MLMSSLAMSLSFISHSECKAETNLLSNWNDYLKEFNHLSVFYGNWLGMGGRMEQDPLGPGAWGWKSQLRADRMLWLTGKCMGFLCIYNQD